MAMSNFKDTSRQVRLKVQEKFRVSIQFIQEWNIIPGIGPDPSQAEH
jgi:hypothetical protein